MYLGLDIRSLWCHVILLVAKMMELSQPSAIVGKQDPWELGTQVHPKVHVQSHLQQHLTPLYPRDGFCLYPGFRTLAEIAGAFSMLISSTLSLWKPFAKDARIPDTSKYSQFFSRSRCNCTHTCMILFYDRFDKTAI